MLSRLLETSSIREPCVSFPFRSLGAVVPRLFQRALLSRFRRQEAPPLRESVPRSDGNCLGRALRRYGSLGTRGKGTPATEPGENERADTTERTLPPPRTQTTRDDCTMQFSPFPNGTTVLSAALSLGKYTSSRI